MTTFYPLVALALIALVWVGRWIQPAGPRTLIALIPTHVLPPALVATLLCFAPIDRSLGRAALVLAVAMAVLVLALPRFAALRSQSEPWSAEEPVEATLAGGLGSATAVLFSAFALLGYGLSGLDWAEFWLVAVWSAIAADFADRHLSAGWRCALSASGVSIPGRTFSWPELAGLRLEEPRLVLRFRSSGSVFLRALRFDALHATKLERILAPHLHARTL